MNKNIILSNGVELKEIPIIPTKDYMAGDDGNIYSRKTNGTGLKTKPWHPLKKGWNLDGYYTVNIHHGGIKKTMKISRLICSAFHGSPLKEKNETRHLDGSRKNDLPNNLEWGSRYDNWKDSVIHGTTNIGVSDERHPKSKLKNCEKELLMSVYKSKVISRKQVAKMFGFTESGLKAILYREKKKN